MYVIHLGVSGFPHDNGNIQRIRLTFKSIKRGGLQPLIINRISSHKSETKKNGIYSGIPYFNLSQLPYRPDNFISRNINKFTGFINEFLFLVKKRKKIDTAIFYGPKFIRLLYYKLLSKTLGFKLIIQYVELRSAINYRQTLRYKINDYLFDNYCFYLCDGIIVISEYLKDRAINKNKNVPWIKLPAITDFSAFKVQPFDNGSNYIMYCGGLEYVDVITFVIELFEKTRDSNVYKGKLILVIGGKTQSFMDLLLEKINNSKYKNDIILKTNLTHKELLPIYLSADLLLIPLRNTLQDIARFPHKISEYTASGRPFLSTNIGDIKYYFGKDNSAVLADEYSVDSYYEAVSEIISDKKQLDEMGAKSHQIGLKYFNYEAYSDELREFISKI